MLRACAECALAANAPSPSSMLTTSAVDSVTSKTPTTAHTGIWIQSPMPRPLPPARPWIRPERDW